MNAFFSLLPIYIFGNLHCAGMCGPLVMLLAKHPYRWWYFFGRLLSFALVGSFSAEMGMFLFSFLNHYHISASFSLLFGIWILLMGTALIFNVRLPKIQWLEKKSAKVSIALGKLMASRSFYGVFLFGASTILLPCGQTLIVFSIIALNCSPLSGLLQGFLFALFTSPSLVAAMKSSQFFFKQKKVYHVWMGAAVLFVGALSLSRGLADLNVIKHFVLNPDWPRRYHIVLF